MAEKINDSKKMFVTDDKDFYEDLKSEKSFEAAITAFIHDWCGTHNMKPFEFSGEYRDGYITAKAKTIKTRPRLTAEDSSFIKMSADYAYLHSMD